MRVFGRLSLQWQIIAGVVPGVVLLLLIFGWLAENTARETRDLALEGRLATANASAHAIDEILLHEAEELQEAARQIGAMSSSEAEQELLGRIGAVIDEYHVIIRLDDQGQPLWAVPPSFDASSWRLAADPAVAAAVTSGELRIFRPTSGGSAPIPFAVVITPIEGQSGETAGFLAGELPASAAHLIPLVTLGESASALLVDESGAVIAFTGEGPLTEDDWEAHTIDPLLKSRQPGTTIDDEHGRSHVEAYNPLSRLSAGVVVEERRDRALAIPKRLERNMLVLGIGAVIAAAAAVLLHSRGVVGPIRALTRASSKIAAGALDTPISTNRHDEVGQLAQSFETMRRRLQESRDERERWEQELEGRVRKRTLEVQSLLGRVISAQEEERLRIARDLHDESAQELVALLAGIQAAEAAIPSSPDKARQTLADLRPLAKRALEEMRKSILDLRPSALDDLGLASAIRWYAESRLRPDLKLRWDITGEFEGLPEPTAIALFRIAQEALNNVAKHSRAKAVWIRLHANEEATVIEVEDDGEGFDPASLQPSPADTRGLGILGMKERAALIGGTVTIDSKPGRGTVARIAVPSRPEDEPLERSDPTVARR